MRRCVRGWRTWREGEAMNCPLENTETAGVLLDYCTRKLDAQRTELLERHIGICPACRQFAENQRAVWTALDSWEVPPVSDDFDRRLYAQIDAAPGWRDRLAAALRPVFAYRAVPALAALAVILTAGILLEHPRKPTLPPPQAASTVEVRPEQVEKALDAIEVLSEFNRKVRPEKAESRI
jgi:anti-sigma factor RsiW